jgi:hypothetical protein
MEKKKVLEDKSTI